MSFLRAFFTQPSRPYRNFQIAFTVLTLNFVLPALTYTFAPEHAVAQVVEINTVLGGAPYPFDELSTRLWRYLGAANVMTLGFMCFLLQLNLRRFYSVLMPLSFMKGYAAAMWLAGFVASPELRVFGAAFVLDAVTCTAFVFFAGRARRDIEARPDMTLVPQPAFAAGKSA
ncbi:MAG: hypothetical protein HYZ27_02120 [Deltaproteobacteria bacterium]|nr:hypothetical protein [Deltaproteobacteria bacterium]